VNEFHISTKVGYISEDVWCRTRRM